MEAFAYRDGAYASSMSTGEALLLRQLASEVLVVLDDPGDFALDLVHGQRRHGNRNSAAKPARTQPEYAAASMSEDDEDAARMRALTEDLLRTEKSVRLRTVVSDLEHITHGDGDTLVIPREGVWEWLGALNDIRLGLAGELDLSDQSDAQRVEEMAMSEPTGERAQTVAAIYMLITWWQDSLLEAVNNSQ